MPLQCYSVPEAKNTILKRGLLSELPVSPALQAGIQQVFGETLSPEQVVDRILHDVRERGDEAVLDYTRKIDGFAPESLLVSADEISAALAALPQDLRSALELSIERVRNFHRKQPVTSWITNDLGGTLGQWVRPIWRVGLYIPAGTAPLPSTVIMSAVPAQVAGVTEIVLVSPPEKNTGKVNQGILAAASLLGIDEVYAIGGAQAIGALAYGTRTIRRVDKIFGPGNIFVTIAKQKVFGAVGIDNLAGPTETLVIADDSANPEWVAADLLAQAEHDSMASAILLTPSQSLIAKVQAAVERQLAERKRRETIRQSLKHRSGAVLTASLAEACELSNAYAPEHLCLSVEDPWAWTEKLHAAGGVFVGEHSFEVLGDYAAGPSHCMPTGGSARFSSPINVLDFIHLVSLIAMDPATARSIAPAAARIAHFEGLDAHANAAEVRL
ncbi:MAG: histidinol dehydrogenase [Anaerolineae bacterium]|nr:histidinol dehydrogenase [Anaerolineae bacterium]